MTEGFDKLAGAIGDTLKTAPTLYEDVLQSTTQESGKTLALIPRAINAALVPLRQWIAEREYKIAETEKLLSQKLEHISEENIITPDAYVAVPAIQAISYSMDSEELRNLYVNLLSKAMNSNTKNLVHPSFVEIIKQMSPIDSMVFKTIMERKINPIIDLVYAKVYTAGFPFPSVNRTIASNISDINIASIESISMSIDNLTRLGLILISDDTSYTDERVYIKIKSSSYYIEQQHLYPDTPSGYTLYDKKKLIEKNNLGSAFYKACVIGF